MRKPLTLYLTTNVLAFKVFPTISNELKLIQFFFAFGSNLSPIILLKPRFRILSAVHYVL